MTVGADFSVAARRDIEAGFAWYEEQASGLGADFLRSVKLAEVLVARGPEHYPLGRGPVRRALLRRFP